MDWTEPDLRPLMTLTGDAVHNMSPYRGQGLNNALEDAAKLVDELVAASEGAKKLTDAITEYEIEISKMAAITSHKLDQLMQSPMFKSGMHKYREDVVASNKPVELAKDDVQKQ